MTEIDPAVRDARGMGMYVLDERGEPKLCNDVIEWGKWYGTPGAKTVARVRLRDADVSTIFLGLDHNFRRFDPGAAGYAPVLWETMIFGGKYHHFQWRYSSREDALRGHALAIAFARRHPSAPARVRRGEF